MSVGQARRKRSAPRRSQGTLFALVFQTIRLQFRGAFIWGVVLGLYSAAIVATFPTFGDMEQMDQLMQTYPEGMREAFNIEDMGTPEGFLDSQVFNLAPLALAFFTILASAGAIAGAEERGTIDVLLGNPLPRWQLLLLLISHQGRHRLGELRRRNAGRPGPPGGARLRTARHLYIAGQLVSKLPFQGGLSASQQ